MADQISVEQWAQFGAAEGKRWAQTDFEGALSSETLRATGMWKTATM